MIRKKSNSHVKYTPTGKEITDAIDLAVNDARGAAVSSKDLFKTIEKENPNWKLHERRVSKYFKRYNKKGTNQSHNDDDDISLGSTASTASRASIIAHNVKNSLKHMVPGHHHKHKHQKDHEEHPRERKSFIQRLSTRRNKKHDKKQEAPVPTEMIISTQQNQEQEQHHYHHDHDENKPALKRLSGTKKFKNIPQDVVDEAPTKSTGLAFAVAQKELEKIASVAKSPKAEEEDSPPADASVDAPKVVLPNNIIINDEAKATNATKDLIISDTPSTLGDATIFFDDPPESPSDILPKVKAKAEVAVMEKEKVDPYAEDEGEKKEEQLCSGCVIL